MNHNHHCQCISCQLHRDGLRHVWERVMTDGAAQLLKADMDAEQTIKPIWHYERIARIRSALPRRVNGASIRH